jgi:hypothetical protein
MKAGKLAYIKMEKDIRFFLHDVTVYLESCRQVGQPEPVRVESKNPRKNP